MRKISSFFALKNNYKQESYNDNKNVYVCSLYTRHYTKLITWIILFKPQTTLYKVDSFVIPTLEKRNLKVRKVL